MPHFHYLTVQDVLWINQEITRKVEKFDYARLEEAVFYQYALGENAGLVPQATRLLTGFLRMQPFEVGNETTALVTCAAFLRLNGKVLQVDASGSSAFVDSAKSAGFSLESNLADAPNEEHLDTKAAINIALESYGSAPVA